MTTDVPGTRIYDFGEIKNSRYFRHLPEKFWKQLLPAVEFQDFPQGTEMIKAGRTNNNLFFLLTGIVEIHADGVMVMSLQRVGDIFGERSAFSVESSNESAVAKTDIQVATMRTKDIGQFTDTNTDEVFNAIYRIIAMIESDKLELAKLQTQKSMETLRTAAPSGPSHPEVQHAFAMHKPLSLHPSPRPVQTGRTTLSLDDLIGMIQITLMKSFYFDAISIHRVDDQNANLAISKIYQNGKPVPPALFNKYKDIIIPLDSKKSSLSIVIRENREICFSKVSADTLVLSLDKKYYDLIPFISILIFPIEARGKTIGCITFYGLEQGFELSRNQMEEIRRHVLQIGTAIDNAAAYEQSQQDQADLEQAHQFKELILRYAPIGIYTIDPGGIVTSHNPAIGKMLGDPDLNLVGKNLFEIDGFKEDFKTKYDVALSGLPTRLEFWFYSYITGRKLYLKLWMTPLMRASAVEQVLVLQYDDTDRMEAGNALLEEKEFTENILKYSPIATLISDPQGNIIYSNSAVGKLFGYGENQSAVGLNVLKDIVEVQQSDFSEKIKQIFLGNITYTEIHEIPFVSAITGVTVVINLHIAPLIRKNDVIGAIIMLIDVSAKFRERQEKENAYMDLEKTKLQLAERSNQLEAAGRAKSEFLANMSHEIRTPMNAILGFTELALKTDLSNRQQDYLDKIRISSLTLRGVINDILDFSKIEAGKLNIERVDFNLSHVLANVSNTFAKKTGEKGIELIVPVTDDIPDTR